MSLLEVNIQQAGYKANIETIRNIHFSIMKSELVGMIGSNGAGKSSTIKAFLGELPFLNGEVKREKGSNYSYIPERPIFYPELTLWEHFEFITAVEELGESSLSYAKEILKKFRLIDRIHEFPATFSKGMQQKGMIALALFTKPDLLIIDEPFMGLDPGSTKLLLNMLEEEREKGTGILMCTHILDTAQRICDSFIIIENGTMKASGSLGEVLEACGAEDGSLYSCISIEDEVNE
ncbi:ATP-binding cassette domain-containing protein [Lederbergia wuyishanensis]|uniref:ABC-2 type transport system ATP-binding protein n=1 Tax=Lederbergia wuyishanensis TaxID=1347903 RepID=A0ABU0D4W1_9BACI|nr:ABC transporter ATP-binding protein [Lederbergia wuyishanensis]MCJ8009542.1 ABC transporter ATP-binding protein [Lederbergia wuyishanensis]MDQ0343447.1 ABC-2 type transport system ATP-binding protein [Lederbergia wuyishanensis]